MKKTATPNQIFIDLVCCMEVHSGDQNPKFSHKLRTYYFCDEACRNAFAADPEKYLNPKTKRKGLWGRYLERLEKATGGKSLNCH